MVDICRDGGVCSARRGWWTATRRWESERDMQMSRMRVAGSLVLAAVVMFLPARAQKQEDAGANTAPAIGATIDASKVGEPISKYDYGMFIEHLANLVNHLL